MFALAGNSRSVAYSMVASGGNSVDRVLKTRTIIQLTSAPIGTQARSAHSGAQARRVEVCGRERHWFGDSGSPGPSPTRVHWAGTMSQDHCHMAATRPGASPGTPSGVSSRPLITGTALAGPAGPLRPLAVARPPDLDTGGFGSIRVGQPGLLQTVGFYLPVQPEVRWLVQNHAPVDSLMA
jgi:hypothetical protein